MGDPFVANRIHVPQGSEWDRIADFLGTLIDHGPLLAAERHARGVGFDEILVDLRSYRFEQVSKVAEEREIPEHSVSRLEEVVEPQQDERCKHHHRPKQRRIEDDGQTVENYDHQHAAEK